MNYMLRHIQTENKVETLKNINLCAKMTKVKIYIMKDKSTNQLENKMDLVLRSWKIMLFMKDPLKMV